MKIRYKTKKKETNLLGIHGNINQRKKNISHITLITLVLMVMLIPSSIFLINRLPNQMEEYGSFNYPIQLKTAQADFGSAEVVLLWEPDVDFWVSIGDNLSITYTNTSFVSSVTVNLTHYGGADNQPLSNDEADSEWVLNWTVKEPYPFGIYQDGPVNLTITASNGTHVDVKQPNIDYPSSGWPYEVGVDTISPTIESLTVSEVNVSRNSGIFMISLIFSESVTYIDEVSKQPQSIIFFSPDVYGEGQFPSLFGPPDYHVNENNFIAINVTYMINNSHHIGWYENINVNITNIRESNKPTKQNINPNLLRNGTVEFSDVFSIDVKSPQNPDSYNSYSHTLGEYTNNNTISISWAGQSDVGSGIHGFWIVWDDEEYTEVYSSIGYFTTTPSNTTTLPDGSWYLHIITVDNFGNVALDPDDEYNQLSYHIGPFHIDTTPPSMWVSSPSNESSFGSTAPSFNLDIEDNNLDTTWYSLDGGQTNTTFTGSEGQIIPQGIWETLDEGQIIITFYANDSAGNIASYNFVVYKDLSVDDSGDPGDSPIGIAGFEVGLVIIGISLTAISIVIYKKKKITF